MNKPTSNSRRHSRAIGTMLPVNGSQSCKNFAINSHFLTNGIVPAVSDSNVVENLAINCHSSEDISLPFDHHSRSSKGLFLNRHSRAGGSIAAQASLSPNSAATKVVPASFFVIPALVPEMGKAGIYLMANHFSAKCLLLLSFLVVAAALPAVAGEFDRMMIPRVKYDGGGDWYVGPTSMPNLVKQAGERLRMPVQNENIAVSISDPELFRYPMLFLTGHGQVRFKDHDINTLLVYLDNGGFLWVNDSYGIDKFIRREIRRLYPDRELVLLPTDHPIFAMAYDFKDGLPKIHEHDGKPPAAWALFDKGRMKILYTYESDIGDGLEDAGVHPNDTPEIREKAMQMALNILVYVMMQ